MVDELTPTAVLRLVFEERGHHGLVTLKDASALRMVGGQIAEQLGHAGGNPTVAAAPKEGDIGSVKEEAVGLRCV